jgi:EAL domain-containing protein (putative c-di-GMP-specific phosphodiesterase class I)
MAVNIAPSLLTAIDLPERIESLLGAEGVAPSRLIVEITEDAMVANEVIAADILLRLRIKGVGLAIDDFGTGYSSLASLARMPFNELKIDRSFVHNCRADNDFMKIVKASIGIAHDLNMKAVAEGIEDEATKDILANLKCDIGQGYLFSKPLPAADFIDWVFDWSRYSGSRQKIKA